MGLRGSSIRPKVPAAACGVLLLLLAIGAAPGVYGRERDWQLVNGADQAIDFFEKLVQHWERILLPLGKQQVARRLRKLSTHLDGFAREKEEFAQKLLDAETKVGRTMVGAWPIDPKIREEIDGAILNFQNRIHVLRDEISEFSSILPGPYHVEGRNVADKLSTGLTLKWYTLNDIAKEITGHVFDRDKVACEMERAAQKMRALRSVIDRLITNLETGSSGGTMAPPDLRCPSCPDSEC